MVRICGIYCITNTANNKKYIGQSINVNKRLYDHKYNLRKGRHSNKHLQSSYNKYGVQNFKFEVLKECSVDELDDLEKEFIKKFDSTNNEKGYNLEHGGIRGKRVSLESKIRRRGKRRFPIHGKGKFCYAFKNMCTELWNLSSKGTCEKNFSKIFLPVFDVNSRITAEDYESEDITSDDYVVSEYEDYKDYETIYIPDFYD